MVINGSLLLTISSGVAAIVTSIAINIRQETREFYWLDMVIANLVIINCMTTIANLVKML